MKFETGDLVILNKGHYPDLPMGSMGIVVRCSTLKPNGRIEVFMPSHSRSWHFGKHEFTHAHEYNKDNT